MNRKNRREDGFACIFVLMLTVALFILATLATQVMYAAHQQNRRDRDRIIKRAEALHFVPAPAAVPPNPSK